MAVAMGVEAEPVEGAAVATGVGDEVVAEGVIEGAALAVGDAGRAPAGDSEGADPHPASTSARARTLSRDAAR
jgi:hypothetical protein